MSESEVKEDDNETEHASTATPHPVEPAKKKKKKRKKKASKQQAGAVAGQRRSSEDKSDVSVLCNFRSADRHPVPGPFEPNRNVHANDQMDEIIRTLREVDKMFGCAGKSTAGAGAIASSTNPVIKQLLSVQHKNLNASYEMKRMFGSRVVQAEQ